MALINGTPVADTLAGGSAVDTINGGDGNDSLRGGGGNDFLFGDIGTDRLFGESGNDNLSGGQGDDTLDGGAGTDTLDGGVGIDVLLGGDGNDLLLFDAADLAGSGVRFDGGAGTDALAIQGGNVNFTGIADNQIAGIEVLDLSRAGSGANAVTLNRTDVLALSNSTNTLRVEGGAGQGDSVVLLGFTANGTQSVSGESYNRYVNNGATVLVDKAIAVSFTPANPIPTALALAGNSVNENSAAGTVVGTLSATDPGDTLTYSLVNDAGGRFTVVGNELRAAGSGLNFEAATSHSITVRVTDSAGNVLDQNFTVQVNNLNEAPVVNDQALAINENPAAGAVVGTVAATDPDNVAPNNSLTYSILSGNESGAFAINASTGQITVANASLLDYEATPSFALTVQVKDAGAGQLTDTATVTVNLNNVDEVPHPPVSASGQLNLSALNGTTGFAINGIRADDFSGFRVSGIGDVNGDGYEDVLIGASGADPAGRSRAGESYVVFGGSSFASSVQLSAVAAGAGGFAIRGISANDQSGFTVSGAGDVNGDGYQDFLIGTYGATPGSTTAAGETYLVYGRSSFTGPIELSSVAAGSGGFVINGVNAQDLSGTAVSSAGDFNGDGYDDLLIGARGVDATGSNAGASYLIYGSSNLAGPVNLSAVAAGTGGFVINGNGVNSYSGVSVSSAGDLNGDGYDDLVIGANGANGFAGQTYVLFGHSGASANVALSSVAMGSGGFVINGVNANDFSGRSVASAGDLNGDGLDDLVVSAFGADPSGRTSAGSTYVIYGKTSFGAAVNLSAVAAGSGGFVIQGAAANDFSGVSVSSAGDVNGDGYDDLLIGANGADPSGRSFAGRTYVVYGGPGLPSSIQLSAVGTSVGGFVVNGVATNDGSGYSVSAAGDVNGDGFADLLIGAYGADPNGSRSGQSYVIFGGVAAGTPNLIYGGPGGQSVTGTASAERIVGGTGNDTLNGAGGNDVLLGGAGNDVLVYDPADTLGVDGGTGRDTLRVSGVEVSLNLTSLNAGNQDFQRYTSIEIIDLHGGGNSLTLNSADLLHLGSGFTTASGARQNLLRVDGTASDRLDVPEEGWTLVGEADADGNLIEGGDYRLFQHGAAQLLVQDGVQTHIGLNEAPVNSVPDGVISVSIGHDTSIHGLSVSDVDAGSANIQVTLSVDQGSIHVAEGVLGGLAAADISGNDTGSVTLTGSQAAINATLSYLGDGEDGVTYNSGAVAANSATLTITTNDLGHTGGPAQTDTDTVALDLNLVEFDLSDLGGNPALGFRVDGQALPASPYVVSSAGDINHDGFDDVLVGLRDSSFGNLAYSGSAYLIFGGTTTGATVTLTTNTTGVPWVQFGGMQAYGHAGSSVAAGGDINADGQADFLFGAPDQNVDFVYGGGVTYVGISGSSGTFTVSQDDNYSGHYSFSGSSVASAGDINGDGFDDYLIGAPGHSEGDSSRTYVVFGSSAAGGPVSLYDIAHGNGGFVVYGVTSYDGVGRAVASAGDVNGDGYDDFIIGAPGASYGQLSYAGAAYVVYGQAGIGSSGVLNLYALDGGEGGFVVRGGESFGRFGSSVASAGDFDGDGYDDVAIGAPDENSYVGNVYIVFGGPDGAGPGVTIHGIGDSNHRAGYSVASAGDINGDGYDDLVIGAPYGSADGHDGNGITYVVFGSAVRPDTIELSDIAAGNGGFVIHGVADDDRSGYSVAGAGDINGDGFDDLIIGSSGYNDGESFYSYAQEAYVIYGRDFTGTDSLVTGTASAEALTGGDGVEQLLGGLGNDTLDGSVGDDVLIGGAGDDVLVFDASDTLRVDGGNGRDTLSLAGSSNVVLDLAALDNFGDASQAPVNPYTDIEVIDLHGGSNTLELNSADLLQVAGAYVTSGNGTRNNLLRVDGGATDSISSGEFWQQIGTADADGTLSAVGGYTLYTHGGAKLLVQNSIGSVEISHIDLSALNGADGFRLNGTGMNDYTGLSVSSAGDINGDGFDDLIVGAHGFDGAEGGPNAGAAFVIFGKPGGSPTGLDLSSLNGYDGFRIDGEITNDHAGFWVSAAGDVDGDGFADVIVGAINSHPIGSFSGAAWVIHGSPLTFNPSINLYSIYGYNGFQVNGTYNSHAGFNVSEAGDVNGDGFADVIISAPDSNGTNGGAYVVFGGPPGPGEFSLGGLTGSNGFGISGQAPGDHLDRVSSAGDVNGDGIGDFIVGGGLANGGTGAAYVIFGSTAPHAATFDLATLNGTNGFKVTGLANGDDLGFAIASAGDLNGDGFDDVVIGAKYAMGMAGQTYVIYGNSAGFSGTFDVNTLDGTNGYRITGAAPGDRSGESVASAGDINGDGYDDLVVGAWGADANGADSGTAYVIFGSATGPGASLSLSSIDGSNGIEIRGVAAGDHSGSQVSSAGDVNGDGYDDLIIGALYADGSATQSGAAYLVYGRDFGNQVDVLGDASSNDITLSTGQQGADGGGGSDTLTGNAGDNTLVGGLGDDVLDGAGGHDVLIGGAGDDVLIFDSADTLRVDGGNEFNFDTLRFIGADDLDLRTLVGGPQAAGTLYTGIEVIDLNNGLGNTLMLDANAVLNLSDTSNDLYIVGDGSDTVLLSADFEFAEESASGAPGLGGSFNRYTVSGTDVQVYIDVNIPQDA